MGKEVDVAVNHNSTSERKKKIVLLVVFFFFVQLYILLFVLGHLFLKRNNEPWFTRERVCG